MILLCLLFFLQLVAPIAIPAVKNASLDGSDEVDGEEDVVSQLVKGPEAEINPTTGQSCHEIHKHCPSQAENSCGGEDEYPKACILQNMLKETQSYVRQQPDLSAATTGRGVTEPAEDNVVIDVNSDSQHCPSQAEKTCGGEDEHAKACMLQNMPEETQSYVQQQPDLSAATTSRGVTEPAEDYVAMDVNLDSRLEKKRGIEKQKRKKR